MATSACYLSVVFLFLYVASTVSADTIGKVAYNPADELVAIVNAKRIARGLSTLHVSPVLTCIAVQYIKAYEGDCDAVGGPDEKKPPESAFAVTFAPKCGVRSSTLTPITGRFLGCQANYVDAARAFSEILITNPESLDILYSEGHTQVGVAVTATDGGKVAYNPADELVAIVNAKRIARGLSTLHVSPVLTCIAGQYIKAYEGDCEAVGGPDEKKPPESAFAVTFAPKCGVRSSTLAPITGRFFGCHANFVDVAQVFYEILITNRESLEVLYSESHTQVGAAVMATDGGSPYFWCVLFSNGTPHSTSVFDNSAYMIVKLAGLAELVVSIGVLIIGTNLVRFGHLRLLF